MGDEERSNLEGRLYDLGMTVVIAGLEVQGPAEKFQISRQR